MQRDANVSPFKTFNTISRWNGVKGQENDKRLHTAPEDWKCKSIKWMCGETFLGPPHCTTTRTLLVKVKKKTINRNWSNQKVNPALKTKAGNK